MKILKIMTKHNPVKKHYHHPIYLVKGKFGPHHGKIMCKLCNTFVKWATKSEIKEITNESI